MRATHDLNARSSNARDTFQPGSRRALRLALCALAICTIAAQPALAADDDEEEPVSFEQGIIRNLLRGIGATNLDNGGIDYRERSPLVIPPKVELRAPETQRQVTAPNWPKDPDVAERQARKEAARKKGGATRDALAESREASRILLPSELAGQPVSRSSSRDSVIPGATTTNPILSPSELGYNGSVFGLFKSKPAEAEKFTGEPTRESLTQPPVGYQTPSPSYAYGSGGPPGSFTPNFQPAPNPVTDNGRR